MKIVTLNLYAFFVLIALVTGGFIIPQIAPLSFANAFDSKNMYTISTLEAAHPVNTFVWSSVPSSSQHSSSSSPSYSAVSSSSSMTEMSDLLTASFTNIIDTQIYTGLDQLSN